MRGKKWMNSGAWVYPVMTDAGLYLPSSSRYHTFFSFTPSGGAEYCAPYSSGRSPYWSRFRSDSRAWGLLGLLEFIGGFAAARMVTEA